MGKKAGKFRVAIPRTRDLAPPVIECTWEVDFEGDEEYEKILLAYYLGNYEAELKKIIGAQAAYFAKPLESMQKEIDEMRLQQSLIDNQMNLPRQREMRKNFLARFKVPLKDKIDAFQKYLVAAVQNIKTQQLSSFGADLDAKALKNARKAVKGNIRNKKSHHIIGVTVRGAVVVGATAAAVVATVASFGVAAAPIGALMAAFVGLKGVAGVAKTAKEIFDIRDLEKRTMLKLLGDVDTMTGGLDGVQVKLAGIAKHINMVSMYYSKRVEKTAALQAEMTSMRRAVAAAKSKLGAIATANPKIYKANVALLAEAETAFAAADATWQKSFARGEQLKVALAAASAVVGGIAKIPFQAARTLPETLRAIDLTDVDAHINVVNKVATVGGKLAGGLDTD